MRKVARGKRSEVGVRSPRRKKSWLGRNLGKTVGIAVIAIVVLGLYHFIYIPMRTDFDHDGLTDWDEMHIYHTDPHNPDSDNDGLLDGLEIEYGSEPNSADTSGDGILDGKAVALDLDPTKSYPIMGYVLREGYSDEIVKGLKNLDNYEINEDKVIFLKKLSKFPAKQADYVKWVFSDGKISRDESNQTEFLINLSREDFERADGRNLICDLDWDDDGFTNWFENNISKTDHLSINDRYAILVGTCGEIDCLYPFNKISEFLTDGKVPENHIIKLFGENATYENFCSAIDRVKSLDKRNDITLIALSGHGARTGFGFRETREGSSGFVYYSDLNQQLNKLDSKIVLTNDSCHSGGSLPYLSAVNRVIISQVKADQTGTWSAVNGRLVEALGKRSADLDNNGYISCAEIFSYVEHFMPPGKDPQISGENHARKIYLVEHCVMDKDITPLPLLIATTVIYKNKLTGSVKIITAAKNVSSMPFAKCTVEISNGDRKITTIDLGTIAPKETESKTLELENVRLNENDRYVAVTKAFDIDNNLIAEESFSSKVYLLSDLQ